MFLLVPTDEGFELRDAIDLRLVETLPCARLTAQLPEHRVLEQGEVFFGHDGFLFRDGCTLLELVADNEKETCQKVTSHLQPARAMFDARLVLLRFPRLALALGGPEFVQ